MGSILDSIFNDNSFTETWFDNTVLLIVEPESESLFLTLLIPQHLDLKVVCCLRQNNYNNYIILFIECIRRIEQ